MTEVQRARVRRGGRQAQLAGLVSIAALCACRLGPPSDPASEPQPPPTAVPTEVPELAFPGCAELSALWVSRYHQTLRADWALKGLDCSRPDARSVDRAFAEAAYLLEHTRFRLAELPEGYEPPPAEMLKFVTQKYVRLSIQPTATYPATDVDNKILYFYPGVGEETGFQVIGNLIHEARHADGRELLHVACTGGANAGHEMCDDGLTERFTEGGSHAIAILYFAWAAARSNWPQDMKDLVRGVADWLVDERINATAAQRADWKQKYLRDW